MKRKIVFAALFTLVLSGCTIDRSVTNVELVNDRLYSFILKDEEVISFNQANTTEISYYVVQNEPLNPYFSLKDYFSLYEPIKNSYYTFDVSKSGYNTIVKVTDLRDQALFAAQINTLYKEFYVSGDFSEALKNAKDYSRSSLQLRARTEYKIEKNPSDVIGMNYHKAGYKSFTRDGVDYFPLSLLESAIGPNAGVRHLFNYKRLIQFDDAEQLSKQKYIVDGVETTAYEEMSSYIKNIMITMPKYLINDRKSAFDFIIENLYGLKYTRNINSMVDYLSNQSFYSDFYSSDSWTRREAYNKVFALLDDGHTSTRDTAEYPWYENTSTIPYGSHVLNLYNTRETLSKMRNLTPGKPYYSSDEQLAFVSFDSFTFAENAYDEDGTMKDLADYNSEAFDSYFYLAEMLRQIKEKGTVKDVVIDISQNGGGIVGVLFKILPLLSKDNYASFYIKSTAMDMVQKYMLACDSTGEGLFDKNDCYGNDFNFYLLTSGFTFSCANAFAFFAKKNGIAKIIGERSGGGECTVAENYLPSGEHFYHSGHNHIGWYENSSFEGDEPGVEVDIAVEYENYYNVDALKRIINQ